MLNQKIKPHSDIIATELDNGEAVLLHLNTKKYYSLNVTGLRIWQLLGKGLTPVEICGAIQTEFDVTDEMARESVLKIVTELKHEHLVQFV